LGLFALSLVCLFSGGLGYILLGILILARETAAWVLLATSFLSGFLLIAGGACIAGLIG